MTKYTLAQTATIQKFATQLYEVGFLADSNLAKTSCSCCRAKRELLSTVKRALAKKGKQSPK